MRRGKGSEKRKKRITIFYNNINGITTKKDSIVKTVQDVKPDIIALCETRVGSVVTLENILDVVLNKDKEEL